MSDVCPTCHRPLTERDKPTLTQLGIHPPAFGDHLDYDLPDTVDVNPALPAEARSRLTRQETPDAE